MLERPPMLEEKAMAERQRKDFETSASWKPGVRIGPGTHDQGDRLAAKQRHL